MPDSISSVPESPRILAYVGSIGCLVFSLMLTAFGYTNNAWIVLYRPFFGDEFQRGVRGLDCYKSYHPENIMCLSWGYENKSEKFPVPFERVQDPSIVVHVAYYLTLIILVSQLFWLVYTVGHCCSLKFCQRAEKYKLALFHIMVTTVGIWIILLFLIIYGTFTNQVLPQIPKNENIEHQIGTGFWIFFLGGAIPFAIALYFLFEDQMQASKDRLRALIRRRQQVPTNDGQEMIRRDTL